MLSAYEADPQFPMPALIVFGPFMSTATSAGPSRSGSAKFPNLGTLTFTNNLGA